MADRLQVGVPDAFRLVICVTHIIANLGGFPAEFTFPAHEAASFLLESITISLRPTGDLRFSLNPTRAIRRGIELRDPEELLLLTQSPAKGKAF